MATKNRRRYLRTRAQNLVAHFKIGDRSVLAPIEDISVGGAFLKTSEVMHGGMVLAFDVARPGLKRPLRLMGRVVEARAGRGIGLRFDGLDRETHERLVELLRDLGALVSTSPPDAQEPYIHVSPPRTSSSVSIPAIIVADPPAASAPPAARPPVTQAGVSDEAQRLMVQLRGAIMEVGTLQQQLVQKDRELQDLKEKVASLTSEVRSGGAAEMLVGKMEMEKQRLEAQLAEATRRTRGDIDAVKREADSVLQAMARLVDALKRL
jgi:PilZ domain